jgi:aryl-alcohol dehydrogenase-like predicted oxidoreductase
MTNLSRIFLGGANLGFSVSERNSYKLLDHFFENKGRKIDTSDFYSEWVPGNKIGKSESIIGNWCKAAKNRDSLEILTKVGLSRARSGLSPQNLSLALEDSLRRLRTDYVDIYLSHCPPKTSEMYGFFEAMLGFQEKG